MIQITDNIFFPCRFADENYLDGGSYRNFIVSDMLDK